MKRPRFLTLNVVFAVIVIVGLVSFTAMPSALQIGWALLTIVLAFFLVYQGFRRFFFSPQDTDKPDRT